MLSYEWVVRRAPSRRYSRIVGGGDVSPWHRQRGTMSSLVTILNIEFVRQRETTRTLGLSNQRRYAAFSLEAKATHNQSTLFPLGTKHQRSREQSPLLAHHRLTGRLIA